MSSLKAYLSLIRVRQWPKNALVFAPLLFSPMLSWPHFFEVLGIFFAFCIATSTTYILNDLCDLEADKLHELKCKIRPIAAGLIRPERAKALLAFLYIVLLVSLYFYSPMQIIFAYLLLNILYSYFLKKLPVLDVFTIAVGYVLRIFAGAMVIDVSVSSWMLVTAFCLALFLAVSKRYSEIQYANASVNDAMHRYTRNMLRSFLLISATATLMFYGFYVLTQNSMLLYTIPLVMYGLFRYWFILESNDDAITPLAKVGCDVPLVLVVIVWALACVYSLHLGVL